MAAEQERAHQHLPALPKNITVERPERDPREWSYREPASPSPTPGRLCIRKRLMDSAGVAMWSAVTCILFFFYYAAAVSGGPETGELIPAISVPEALFASPLAALGLFTGYFTLVLLVDTQTITAEGHVLSSHHRPLPWRWSIRLEASSLRRLEIRPLKVPDGHKILGWSIYVHSRLGEEWPLLHGLSKQAQARYLTGLIEEHLGIEEQPSKES